MSQHKIIFTVRGPEHRGTREIVKKVAELAGFNSVNEFILNAIHVAVIETMKKELPSPECEEERM